MDAQQSEAIAQARAASEVPDHVAQVIKPDEILHYVRTCQRTQAGAKAKPEPSRRSWSAVSEPEFTGPGRPVVLDLRGTDGGVLNMETTC